MIYGLKYLLFVNITKMGRIGWLMNGQIENTLVHFSLGMVMRPLGSELRANNFFECIGVRSLVLVCCIVRKGHIPKQAFSF